MTELEGKCKSDQESVQCPHCQKEISFEYAAKAAAFSELTFEITPAKDELCSLDTVGGVLVELEKLHKAAALGVGTRCVALLKGMEVKEGGVLSFRILIARVGTPEYQKVKDRQEKDREKG